VVGTSGVWANGGASGDSSIVESYTIHTLQNICIFIKEKIKRPKGILPSGRSLHDKVGDGGWMGKLAPGLRKNKMS
jgi:hypothetical protein